jgi:hypothetical protein
MPPLQAQTDKKSATVNLTAAIGKTPLENTFDKR